MKITMKTLYATPERSIAAGATAEVADKEAKDLVDKGFAVRADADPAEGHKPAKRTPSRRSSGGAGGKGKGDEGAGGNGGGQGDEGAGGNGGDPDAVPDGPIEEVLDWVGEDADKAARAIEAENAKGDAARSTLVADLEKIGAGGN